MDARALQTSADSYISPIGYNQSSKCGYCEGRRGTGFSYYAQSTSMSAEFYQKLLDRCWRRSGTLLYRPNQKASCCPHYTIRLDSSQYRPSRDQRQTVNRFNKAMVGDEYIKAAAQLYPRSRKDAKKRETEFDLMERIYECDYDRLKMPPDPAHRLEVTLEPDDFSEEKFEVFENYQRIIHKETPDQINRPAFKRFLCSSTIRRETQTDANGQVKRLGSYHQMYRLDGKLVAIGVLDLLPQCVSAVYFLYHESVHKYGFGKLGALREIALAIEGGYKWWYPGFYIHSCPKMRYKIDYKPQYILDPETLTWDLLDEEAIAIFDKQDYVSLSRDRSLARGQPQNRIGVEEPPSSPPEEHSDNDDDPDSDDRDANKDRLSLFDTNMPGIKSRQDMHSVDLDHISVCLEMDGESWYTSDLVVWSGQSMDKKGTLKAIIAEFAAALGPDLLENVCLDFGRND